MGWCFLCSNAGAHCTLAGTDYDRVNPLLGREEPASISKLRQAEGRRQTDTARSLEDSQKWLSHWIEWTYMGLVWFDTRVES